MFDDILNEGRKPVEIRSLDFDEFVEEVKKMPFAQGQDVLWREVFNLERWHFITKPITYFKDAEPFKGKVEGKGWFFLFTDGEHAHKFGERQKFTNADGSVNTIAMKPEEAVEWLEEWAKIGIYGVRFNEGEHGWYAPIENLRPMMKDLKNKFHA